MVEGVRRDFAAGNNTKEGDLIMFGLRPASPSAFSELVGFLYINSRLQT